MQAIVFEQHGGPEVLVSRDVPTPEPGPGEIRIAVKACALNHLDLFVMKGIPGIPYPHIQGADGAGVVEEVGADVVDLRPGMQIAIALYGDARSEPIIVQAEVRSDYAEKGLGLAFHTMTPQAHDRLEALLVDLPPLEQMTDDPDDRQIVVSEILETHSELPQD